MLCWHFIHRNDLDAHPVKRVVMNYVAEWGFDAHAVEELHVRIDRVREVRDIVEDGRLAERA
jgi:hypothetical protein